MSLYLDGVDVSRKLKGNSYKKGAKTWPLILLKWKEPQIVVKMYILHDKCQL